MGPYTWEEVQSYLAQGSLLPTDAVWYEGLETWVPLSQLVPQQAAPVPVAPAPIQTAAVPEQVAAAATVPAQGGGKKKLLIAIGAGVGVLAILAAVWFFLIRDDGSKSGSADANVPAPWEPPGEPGKLIWEFETGSLVESPPPSDLMARFTSGQGTTSSMPSMARPGSSYGNLKREIR